MSEKNEVEESDDIRVGSYVIIKESVGVVVGQSTDGQWIVEWPEAGGKVDFSSYNSDDLVSLDITLDFLDKAE
jgi:hypothetical protein